MTLVCGIGINDSDHSVALHAVVNGKSKQIWSCPYYCIWRGILVRSKESFWSKNPTYLGCTVHDDWLMFSNFENWLKKQPNHAEWLIGKKNWAVDKDFLYPGNKVYSPDACCLLPRYVNNALLDSARIRGEYPIGVSYHKQHKKLYSCIKLENRQHFLGLYDEAGDARVAWQKAKIEALENILKKYRNENNFDNRVCLRLLHEISLIREDIKDGRETKTFGRLAR